MIFLNLQPAPAPQADISASPFGLGSLGGLAGLGNLGMGSHNFMEMQQRMQREVCILYTYRSSLILYSLVHMY